MKDDRVYIMVTRDKYELPLCVCDTIEELSRFSGASVKTIRTYISHSKAWGKKCIYEIVDMEGEE